MDCGVGSIVWVRRRNGSWWPGQILGPDDLSASHLTSPRSGTPVKLLGREDASVDWYNLEKSKRVKAFRCGEFDDCIERAESSQGMPLKKREKYARREDAILHALELERQMLKKQAKLGIACSDRINCRSSNTVKKGIVTTLPLETLGNDNENCANSKSYMSCENEIAGGSFTSELAKEGNRLSGEVDLSEATPRMRGLQDFGLKIAPFKGKLSSSIDPNVSPKLAVDEGARTLASGSLCMGSALHTDGAGQIACRAKRSRCVYFPAESGDSLDYKETLAHVEMSSPQLGGEFPYRGSLVGETESTFMDDVESDSSDTGSTDSDSDSSETEPDMDEEMTILTERKKRESLNNLMERTGSNEFSPEDSSEYDSVGSAHSQTNAAGKKKKKKKKLINYKKPVHLPVILLKIGEFSVVPTPKRELLAKFYFTRKQLVWKIKNIRPLVDLHQKSVVPWRDILSTRVVIGDENKPGILEVELRIPPTLTEDFTRGHALKYRRHYLEFPPGVLEKHYEKLLESDDRFRLPFPKLESPYFDPPSENDHESDDDASQSK